MVRRLIRVVVLCGSLFSLAACLIAAWFWWRSYRTIDRVFWDRGGRHAQLSSVHGRLSLIILPDHSTGPAPPSWRSEPLAASRPAPLERDAYWTEGTSRFWISTEALDRRIGPVRITGGQLAVLNDPPGARLSGAPAMVRTPSAPTPRQAPFPAAAQGPPTATIPPPLHPQQQNASPSAGTARATRPAVMTGRSPSTVPASAPVASNEAGNPMSPLGSPFGDGVGGAQTDPPSGTVDLYPEEFKLFRPLPQKTEQAAGTGYGFAGATPRVGYGFRLVSRTPTYVFDRWTMPYWPLVCAAALPPLLWSGSRARRILVRRRRVRRGMCLACGYDLTDNVSGVCPECGRALERAVLT